jgi:hypothetical protein
VIGKSAVNRLKPVNEACFHFKREQSGIERSEAGRLPSRAQLYVQYTTIVHTCTMDPKNCIIIKAYVSIIFITIILLHYCEV